MPQVHAHTRNSVGTEGRRLLKLFDDDPERNLVAQVDMFDDDLGPRGAGISFVSTVTPPVPTGVAGTVVERAHELAKAVTAKRLALDQVREMLGEAMREVRRLREREREREGELEREREQVARLMFHVEKQKAEFDGQVRDTLNPKP